MKNALVAVMVLETNGAEHPPPDCCPCFATTNALEFPSTSI
jgi:hypothetical protein